MPFTAAAVPTGMNTGVSITPWGVIKRPRRAPLGSVWRTSKWNPIPRSLSGEDSRETHLQKHEDRPRKGDICERFAYGDLLRIRRGIADREQKQHPECEEVEGGGQG